MLERGDPVVLESHSALCQPGGQPQGLQLEIGRSRRVYPGISPPLYG